MADDLDGSNPNVGIKIVRMDGERAGPKTKEVPVNVSRPAVIRQCTAPPGHLHSAAAGLD